MTTAKKIAGSQLLISCAGRTDANESDPQDMSSSGWSYRSENTPSFSGKSDRSAPSHSMHDICRGNVLYDM